MRLRLWVRAFSVVVGCKRGSIGASYSVQRTACKRIAYNAWRESAPGPELNPEYWSLALAASPALYTAVRVALRHIEHWVSWSCVVALSLFNANSMVKRRSPYYIYIELLILLPIQLLFYSYCYNYGSFDALTERTRPHKCRNRKWAARIRMGSRLLGFVCPYALIPCSLFFIVYITRRCVSLQMLYLSFVIAN